MADSFAILSSYELRFSHRNLLRKCLELCGLDASTISISAALPREFSGKTKTADVRHELAAQQARIEHELGGSKWILALGAEAFGYLSGRFKLKGWIGTPLAVGDRTIVATWEPGFLRGAGGRQYLRSFVRHIERVRDLSTGLLEKWEWPRLVVDNGPELIDALATLATVPGYLGCDIETNGGELEHTLIRCIGFGNRDLGVSVPYPFADSATEDAVRSCLLRDGLVFQNGGFDIPILTRNGLAPTGRTEDLLHAHAILAPKSQHSLAFIGGDETHADGWKALHAEDDDEEKDGWATTDPAEMREIRVYNSKDSCMQGFLFPRILERMTSIQQGLYREKMVEDGIARRMHMKGFPLNTWRQTRRRKVTQSIIVPIQDELKELAAIAGVPDLNLNSPLQLQNLYFSKFRVRPVKYDKETGNPSLDVEALEKYTTHENEKARNFSSLLLNYRMHSKVLSTYLEKMKPWADGRIHATFKASGAITGRWAAARPNFFNQPAKIRDMYIAEPGSLYAGADYNALEGRTSALLAGAETLLEWFNDGVDIHTYNAKAIFSVDKPTKSQRNIAKLVFFASIYGAVPTTVWKRMNIMAAKFARQARKEPPPLIPLTQVEAAQKKLFETHPQYPRWFRKQVDFAEKNGCAMEYLSGRTVPFHGHVDYNVAINYSSQAMAQFAAGRALRGLSAELNWVDEYVAMFLYDEIGIIVPKEKANWGVDLLKKHMIQTLEYEGRSVRLDIEPGIGRSWKEAKP